MKSIATDFNVIKAPNVTELKDGVAMALEAGSCILFSIEKVIVSYAASIMIVGG